MNYYQSEIIYHTANLLSIFALVLIYTIFRGRNKRSEQNQEEAEKNISEKTNFETKHDSAAVTQHKKSFTTEILKNFLAGLAIYLLYIFYQFAKP